MNLAHMSKARRIAENARFLAAQLKGAYPLVDMNIIDLAARYKDTMLDRRLMAKRKLSPEEYRVAVLCIEKSGDYAAKLLVNSLGKEGALRVKEAIYDILENYDGSGPKGKKAEEIRPEAYLLKLACAIQNMLDGVPNRNREDDSTPILSNIIMLVGKHYPPELVASSIHLIEMLIESEGAGHNACRLMELGRISAFILHDISDYLAVVSLYLQLASFEAHDQAKVKRLCGLGTDQIEKLLLYKDEMLAFARGDAKKTLGNLNSTIEEALELLEHKLKDVEIRKNYDDIPGFEYYKTEIKQVVANLLKNATEALDSNGGTISIWTYREDDEAVVKISDNGTGMDGEQLRNAFSGMSTKRPGSGMGVSFCKYVIERHNGVIFYESKKGKGTTVCFRLPIFEADSPQNH
jgi:signal transduction histidine kinase